ncbi:hypothetical protein ABTL25_20085, partial [Acinetobacter baumannii]
KLKVDEVALNKRTVNPRPSEYMKRQNDERKNADGRAITYKSKPVTDTAKKVVKDFFQTEFEDEKTDTTKKLNAIPLFTQPKT